jgi:predicted amidohydrolase
VGRRAGRKGQRVRHRPRQDRDLICYDIEFPELARIAAAKGARSSSCRSTPTSATATCGCAPAPRPAAIENGVYTAIAGATGNLPFVDNADIHYAQSGIFTPADIPFARDAIASECTPNIETLIIHDVDTEMLRRHRQMGTVRNLRDRRRELYSVRYFDPDEGELEL